MYIGKIACIDSAMNNTRTLLPTRRSARYEDTASKRNPTCTFSVRVCGQITYIRSCEREEKSRVACAQLPRYNEPLGGTTMKTSLALSTTDLPLPILTSLMKVPFELSDRAAHQ